MYPDFRYYSAAEVVDIFRLSRSKSSMRLWNGVRFGCGWYDSVLLGSGTSVAMQRRPPQPTVYFTRWCAAELLPFVA